MSRLHRARSLLKTRKSGTRCVARSRCSAGCASGTQPSRWVAPPRRRCGAEDVAARVPIAHRWGDRLVRKSPQRPAWGTFHLGQAYRVRSRCRSVPSPTERSLAFGRDGGAHRRQADVSLARRGDEGEVLDMLVQRRRDGRAALQLMRKLLKKQGFVPKLLVTDRLRSYASAFRPLRLTCRHEQGLRSNNRAENSHQAVR
jgi:hypothetical protein